MPPVDETQERKKRTSTRNKQTFLPRIARRRIISRWVLRLRGITRRRITLSRIALGLRGRITIGLCICRLWIPNRRRYWLINAWHLLNWRHSHWLITKFAIPLVHFDLVLRLHACTNRAIHQISHTRQQLRSLLNFITSNNHCNYGKYACYLLEAEHETNNAVITLCCLNIEFILQQKACRGHWIAKAEENLSAKAEFRASAFPTPATTGHITSTACIPWHVIIKCSFTE